LKPWRGSSQTLKNPKKHLLLLNYHDQLRFQHLLPLRLSLLKNLNSSSSIVPLPENSLLQRNPEFIQGWDEFLSALAATDVELSDLDFGLQHELRASPQARADFLALNITTPDALHCSQN